MSIRQKFQHRIDKNKLKFPEYTEKLLVPRKTFCSIFGIEKSKEFFEKGWIKLDRDLIDWIYFIKRYYGKQS